jgi:hypothetical protein
MCARTFETCRSSDVYNNMIFHIIIGDRGSKIQIILDIDNFFFDFFFEKNCPSKMGLTNFTPLPAEMADPPPGFFQGGGPPWKKSGTHVCFIYLDFIYFQVKYCPKLTNMALPTTF